MERSNTVGRIRIVAFEAVQRVCRMSLAFRRVVSGAPVKWYLGLESARGVCRMGASTGRRMKIGDRAMVSQAKAAPSIGLPVVIHFQLADL